MRWSLLASQRREGESSLDVNASSLFLPLRASFDQRLSRLKNYLPLELTQSAKRERERSKTQVSNVIMQLYSGIVRAFPEICFFFSPLFDLARQRSGDESTANNANWIWDVLSLLSKCRQLNAWVTVARRRKNERRKEQQHFSFSANRFRLLLSCYIISLWFSVIEFHQLLVIVQLRMSCHWLNKMTKFISIKCVLSAFISITIAKSQARETSKHKKKRERERRWRNNVD